MCHPVAIALGAMQGISSYVGQRQAAAAQEKAQAAASEAEQLRARQANSSLRLRETQEAIARSQRTEAAQLKGMEAKATAKLVALTEAGVAGQSLDNIIQKFGAQEARYMASEAVQKGLQEQRTFLHLQDEAMRSKMNQLRINQPIRQASLLSSGLSGLQTGMSMMQSLQGLKLSKNPTTPDNLSNLPTSNYWDDRTGMLPPLGEMP